MSLDVRFGRGARGRAMCDRLDVLVDGGAASDDDLEAPIHPPRDDGLRYWSLVSAGVVVAACALILSSASGPLWAYTAHLAEQARTASANATVLAARFDEGGAEDTELVVAYRNEGRRVTASVWKPGFPEVAPLSEIAIAYEPGNPGNVELAARPPIEPWRYRSLIAVSSMLGAIALVVFVVLASARVRAARGVRLALS